MQVPRSFLFFFIIISFFYHLSSHLQNTDSHEGSLVGLFVHSHHGRASQYMQDRDHTSSLCPVCCTVPYFALLGHNDRLYS
uniref:Uncharacterized protein n=1 Tax=Rhipicephalus zambeziensis TaxID=60191 RepID=A0A224Y5Z2_9ACAR